MTAVSVASLDQCRLSRGSLAGDLEFAASAWDTVDGKIEQRLRTGTRRVTRG